MTLEESLNFSVNVCEGESRMSLAAVLRGQETPCRAPRAWHSAGTRGQRTAMAAKQDLCRKGVSSEGSVFSSAPLSPQVWNPRWGWRVNREYLEQRPPPAPGHRAQGGAGDGADTSSAKQRSRRRSLSNFSPFLT